MPQRSRKIGKVTVSVRVDWKKHRQRLSRQRHENGFLEVNAERVDVELDGLVSFVKGKGGCRLDREVDLQLLTELRECYTSFFSLKYPKKEAEERLVNLELALLYKFVAGAPISVTESILNRLEDLFVSIADRGFTNDVGWPNEKLEAVGKIVSLKRIPIQWSSFPIMATFMAQSEQLGQMMDDATQSARQHICPKCNGIGCDRCYGSGIDRESLLG